MLTWFNKKKILFVGFVFIITGVFYGIAFADPNPSMPQQMPQMQQMPNMQNPGDLTQLQQMEPQGSRIDGLIRFYKAGGFFMNIIALVCMFALAVFIERFYSLFLRYDNRNGKDLMNKVQNYVVDNQVDKAIKLCNEQPSSAVLPVVLKAGLKRANRSSNEIQAAVDVATLEVLARLQKRTPFLALFANVSTLVGLLGTILGLIDSFASVKGVDTAQKQAVLAEGISMAMSCTAFGLTIAIGSLLAFGFLSSKTSKIIDEVDVFSAKLVDLLNIAERK